MIPILILIIFYMLILLNIKTQVCKNKKSDYVSFSKFDPKNSQRQTLTWENV